MGRDGRSLIWGPALILFVFKHNPTQSCHPNIIPPNPARWNYSKTEPHSCCTANQRHATNIFVALKIVSRLKRCKSKYLQTKPLPIILSLLRLVKQQFSLKVIKRRVLVGLVSVQDVIPIQVFSRY